MNFVLRHLVETIKKPDDAMMLISFVDSVDTAFVSISQRMQTMIDNNIK